MRHIYVLKRRSDNKVVKICTNFKEARHTYVRFIHDNTNSPWVMEKWEISSIGAGFHFDAKIWNGRGEK